MFADHARAAPACRAAISLAERQILALRERTREQEWRLNELIHNATANETISTGPAQWCARLVGPRPTRSSSPGEIALGLAQQFDLSEVALRLWDLPGLTEGSGYGRRVPTTCAPSPTA